MELKECLNLCARRDRITLIDEGLFLRAYNQSAYLITTFAKQDLKINSRAVRKLANRIIVYVGFPKSQLRSRFHNAIATEFGYEIQGKYDLSGYTVWLKDAMILPQQIAAVESTARAYTSVDVDAGAATSNLLANIQLTPQQLSFLSAWKKGKYPVEVEQDFIISVRNLVFNNKS